MFEMTSINSDYKKKKGNAGETLVANYYQSQGYILIERNYTIPGGELDLIFQKDNSITFVEVKVVDHIDELQDYVTAKKIGHIKHTIEYYLLTHPSTNEYLLDIVFVRDNSILDTYKNVTNS